MEILAKFIPARTTCAEDDVLNKIHREKKDTIIVFINDGICFAGVFANILPKKKKGAGLLGLRCFVIRRGYARDAGFTEKDPGFPDQVRDKQPGVTYVAAGVLLYVRDKQSRGDVRFGSSFR
jgi:hypothetical protein